jgi:hypothetical protein
MEAFYDRDPLSQWTATAPASLATPSIRACLPWCKARQRGRSRTVRRCRARLSTNPAAIGSPAIGNTIGTMRVACCNGGMVESPVAKMTSGVSAASSAACRRISAALVVAHRISMLRLRPTVQPNSAIPAGTPPCGSEIPHRPRRRAGARRSAAFAPLAARGRHTAKRLSRRRAD